MNPTAFLRVHNPYADDVRMMRRVNPTVHMYLAFLTSSAHVVTPQFSKLWESIQSIPASTHSLFPFSAYALRFIYAGHVFAHRETLFRPMYLARPRLYHQRTDPLRQFVMEVKHFSWRCGYNFVESANLFCFFVPVHPPYSAYSLSAKRDFDSRPLGKEG